MKSKKSTYILLPLVIIIWGLLFWKIFSGNPGETNIAASVKSRIVPKKVEGIFERPVLSYHYKDPFLKSLSHNTSQPIKKKEIEQPKMLNRVVRWPLIEYKGAIKSRRKKSKLGLIKIGDKEYLIREQELKKEVRVLVITPDSIGLEFQKDKRYFKRKEI